MKNLITYKGVMDTFEYMFIGYILKKFPFIKNESWKNCNNYDNL